MFLSISGKNIRALSLGEMSYFIFSSKGSQIRSVFEDNSTIIFSVVSPKKVCFYSSLGPPHCDSFNEGPPDKPVYTEIEK